MYNQIAANKRRTAFLFVIVSAILIGFGWLFSQIYGDPIILPIFSAYAVINAWVGYFYSDKIALASSGAQPATLAQAPELYHLLENLTISVGLPMPKVYIIDDPAINAFATGRDPHHASIAVTSGALDKLEKVELEGVLAHELSHVQNRDILVMTVAVTLIGLLSVIAHLFWRVSFWGGRRSNSDNEGGNILMLIGLVLAILSPFIGTLIQLAISRKREYLADASGVLLTRYPEGLARALEKIEHDNNQLRSASAATAHLYIANPFKGAGSFWQGLLATHPPIVDRIRRLRAMGD